MTENISKTESPVPSSKKFQDEKTDETCTVSSKKNWIIQKYIENPLLIMNRKVDIRVWVVVSSWNPLKIYYFKEPYVRFGCNDYDPKTPSNIYSHLTNKAVSQNCMIRPDNVKKLNKVPGNMWSLN